MSSRYEHKYVVPVTLLDTLRRVVEPFVRLDAHVARDGRNAYTVRNIYFDDAGFKAYHQKDDGFEFRAKPRIRGYNSYAPDASVFLEIKRRHGAVGSKDRAVLRFDDLRALLRTAEIETYVPDVPWLPDARGAARNFLFRVHRDALRPVLFEMYEREPYVGLLEPSLRITFDHDIRSSLFPRIEDLFRSEGSRRSLRGSFVLEVKYNAPFGFPTWLRRFIARHGVIREALSKYWTCMTDWNIVAPNRRARIHASVHSPLRVLEGETTATCLTWPHSRREAS